MKKRRILVVDDELPALELLTSMVARRPELEIALATTEYQTVLDFLDEEDVDLMIVDLDLRVNTGYNLMVAVEPPTQVIVCTASKDKGSESLHHGAIDFVEKLVEEDRLNFAIDRALRQLELLEFERETKRYPTTAAFQPEDETTYINVRVAELIYARAEGKSTWLFLTEGRELLVNIGLRNLQALLDPVDFIRCQRGFIVNRDSVGEYLSGTDFGTKHWWIRLRSDLIWTWNSGREQGMLPVGDKYRYRLEKALGVRYPKRW